MSFLSQCSSALVQFLKSPRAWIYLLFVIVAFVMEKRADLLSQSPEKECEKIDLMARLFYERYATAEFRKPRPHYICMMVFSRETVPAEIWGSLCKMRRYEADALRRIARFCPSLIAIDVAYLPDVCSHGQDQADSTALQEAIRDISSAIPVVLAEDDLTTKTELTESERNEYAGLKFENNELIARSQLPFEGEQLQYGGAMFACDTTAVPLFWLVYRSHPPKAEWQPAFAFQAARTHDPELEKALTIVTSRNIFPFISFIPGEFPRVDLGKSDEDLQRIVRGKIVVVGQDRGDNHETVIGSRPGYLLHANYIEALLDDRCFRPPSILVDFILAVIGVLIIAALFEVADHIESIPEIFRPLVALIAALVFLAFVIGLCILCRTYFGLEFVFWMPLVPVPLGEVIYSYRSWLQPRRA